MRRLTIFLPLVAATVALQACNSTESTLDLRSGTTPPAATPEATAPDTTLPPPASQTTVAIAPPPQTPIDGTLGAQAAAIGGMARVQLAPVVGTTVEAARPLSERLEATGKARGIDFRGEGAANIRYVLKGYFSIEAGTQGNTIYYVWDVLDPAGARLHRLSGQEVTAGAADGKWTSVSAPTMEAVADKTIGELVAWLGSRPG